MNGVTNNQTATNQVNNNQNMVSSSAPIANNNVNNNSSNSNTIKVEYIYQGRPLCAIILLRSSLWLSLPLYLKKS